eukprot:gnl/TRDRNA2_/TRDRNA2_146450_c1_seq1.p1 gnl/TRDRNA2_/TRDRNA2_146450_c1~~gnl/TRDRNA2_/TRDRNA2_146450_c1_seq1.p1  ORF type:complete len:100 (+),score=8.44 gnl/TRDRNA2_/TRDRNA2_146450_c1_seq1:43-342(+)
MATTYVGGPPHRQIADAGEPPRQRDLRSRPKLSEPFRRASSSFAGLFASAAGLARRATPAAVEHRCEHSFAAAPKLSAGSDGLSFPAPALTSLRSVSES